MAQSMIGWTILVLGGFLYLAQVISSISFEYAQRLGIQEQPQHTDRLVQSAEQNAAYWDLVTLVWLPLAGFFMIIDHAWWPLLGLFGGAIYLDTSGREAAKYLAFKHAGLGLGSAQQQRVFFASYMVMAAIGMVVVIYSIMRLV